MRGVFGKPFLALDSLVPLHLLDEEAIDMELATAPRYNNVWGAVIPKDAANYLQCPADASPRVHEFYAKNQGQVIQNFAKLAYGAYSPTWVVRLTTMDSKLNGIIDKEFQMQVDDHTLWHPMYDTFPSVWQFIRESGVFESTGRVNFFITDHFCHTPEHTDYKHELSNWTTGFTATAEKEFLWISLKSKNFYVLDDVNNKRLYVDSKCVWFNTLDRHGGEGVQNQTWSLRIDGKFTATFRQKLRDVFGNGQALESM